MCVWKVLEWLDIFLLANDKHLKCVISLLLKKLPFYQLQARGEYRI